MIHTWLRYVVAGLVGLTALTALVFSYVCWLSPTSRLGKHHQQQSYLVHPGMTAQQAFQVMGQPQKQMLREGEVIYTYDAHPFASDNIYLAINSKGIVKNINHGE